MPAKNHLETYVGEAYAPTFTMAPVEDITGWTIVFTLRTVIGNPVLLSIAAAIVNAAAGKFRVTITAAQTDSLATGDYAYDVQRTDAGNETVLSIGTFTVLPDVK